MDWKNIEFNLKNKQWLGEESEKIYHGVQTEHVNDQRKKTHTASGKWYVVYGWGRGCMCVSVNGFD